MFSPETVSPQDRISQVRNSLSTIYGEIEQKALSFIQSGNTADNPILIGKKDERYSLVVCGFIHGQADHILRNAAVQLQKVEPDIRTIPDGFRHIALRELQFHPYGRRGLSLDAQTAKTYYEAVKKCNIGDPMRLELIRIFPSIDKEQNSVSIVGAFVPIGNERAIEIRSEINHLVEQAGLPLKARIGNIQVFFSTIGRLPHPPEKEGNSIPLLAQLAGINADIPDHCETVIDSVNILSTTITSYISVEKHVYMDPPISLVQANEQTRVRFITARQRRRLE